MSADGGGASDSDVKIRDSTERSRYELLAEGELASFEEYVLAPGSITFNSTQTLPGFAGRGLASRLVAHILADARSRGLAVIPVCPFVRAFILKHPEYLDLVPKERRARAGLPLD